MKLALVAIAIATAALFSAAHKESAHELIDKMHAYYNSQFQDLELAKKGIFGASRVESGSIKNHNRTGGDPGYASKQWANTVRIYGNHGLPPDATATLRHSRLPNIGSQGTLAHIKPQEHFAKALKQFAAGKNDVYEVADGASVFQIRPIRLTKKECLSCHSGMKLNSPVALMVYTVAPADKTAQR